MTTDSEGFGSRMAATLTLLEVRDPIICPRHDVTDHESCDEAVGEPDQAPQEGHPVSDEELTEQREVGTDHLPPLEYEPVRDEEDSQTCYQARHDPLNPGVQTQQSGQHHPFQPLPVFYRHLTRFPRRPEPEASCPDTGSSGRKRPPRSPDALRHRPQKPGRRPGATQGTSARCRARQEQYSVAMLVIGHCIARLR